MTIPSQETTCLHCDQPPAAVCTMCHRGFCREHGDVHLALCRDHARLMLGFAAAVCAALLALSWILFWRHWV